jgi:hypothetical protein
MAAETVQKRSGRLKKGPPPPATLDSFSANLCNSEGTFEPRISLLPLHFLLSSFAAGGGSAVVVALRHPLKSSRLLLRSRLFY